MLHEKILVCKRSKLSLNIDVVCDAWLANIDVRELPGSILKIVARHRAAIG